ncbi:PEP-CTERM sorting domain-containing protein [Lacipirellula sp.]|uniref:PEP-CTERM sorting domain-containing protein n=1 Tax=Lacipirellula sp. TaxID=2691419 RepID=UPI003D0B322F
MSVSKFWAALGACGVAATMLVGSANAAPVSVDGTLGAEWAGATVKSVLYNPSAPLGNFGTPTNENATTAYDIYTRGDNSYFYVGITTTGNTYTGGLDFANLYFSTTLTGSNIGFEVTNQNAFVPGVPGNYPYTPGSADIHYSVTPGTPSTPGVLEFAAPWAVFTSNSLGLSPAPAVPTTAVQLRLSQSFGYSVAGGASYGSDRLGQVAVVPEPATIGLAAAGIMGALVATRKRRAS